MTPPGDAALTRLCSLSDDNRRRLYEHVVAAGRPVTRDEASQALGLERSLVAYHLDKLVDEGLLAVSFARPEGRTGPGAGRPAKRYERTREELAVSVPPRDYELLAQLLAQALEHDTSGAMRAALEAAAADAGRQLAGEAPVHDVVALLRQRGFEPYDDGGVIRLRNCPFHRVALAHTELVCHMNVALLRSAVQEVEPGAAARLDPAVDRCCVAIDLP